MTETLTLAPVVRREGLRGAILSWDGQLEDDVRLVLAVARTAAANGARVHTRVKVSDAVGDSATLTDSRTGESRTIRARTVINAAGVWAGQLVPEIRLRPSRGTHIVLRKEILPGVRCAVMAPVPGAGNRFVFALPQPDQTFYVGLTDEEVDGEIPDVPEAPEEDIDFLLRVLNGALQKDVRREDVVGAYAGLRPLLDTGTTTADLSRKHAVLVSSSGVVTVVGGKLTTYRQMAQDAVDRAVAHARLTAGPCITKVLPLLGAAPRDELSLLPDDTAAGAAVRQRGGGRARRGRSGHRSPERTSCWRRSRPRSRRPWRSWSSASPTRARAPWRTCWTGGRASGWSRRTRAGPPAAERALALRTRAWRSRPAPPSPRRRPGDRSAPRPRCRRTPGGRRRRTGRHRDRPRGPSRSGGRRAGHAAEFTCRVTRPQERRRSGRSGPAGPAPPSVSAPTRDPGTGTAQAARSCLPGGA